MSVLDQIKTSSDVQKLDIGQLETLCGEIREEILSVTKNNGGHLASNLGIVETTVALYKVFDFPTDKLIFDVGHQCYAHKILSGRRAKFPLIRTDGGISGFPDKAESEYDAFSAGHAGTSISAGLGYCTARDHKGDDYTVISVVGDGAFSNGLNLEALTATETKPRKFIVILNDNGMSISKNKSGLYRMISKSTMKKGYVGSKRAFRKVFKNSFITKFFAKIKNFIKRVIVGENFLEDYGFKYVGIVNGNDVKKTVSILERARAVSKDRAVLLHVKTCKGKGFKVAEESSEAYHGVGKNFELSSGDFSSALGEKLNSLIEKDNKIVAITAGMKHGTGLSAVEEKHPKNFIDVGIAEEYAVTLSAGMASGGLKPVVAVYSTFLQRAYDQILHDVCLQNLPVIFCIDRAGLVGKDGKTHQGVFDLSFLSHLPSLTILTPSTLDELGDALLYALSLNSPVAIRYPTTAVGKQRCLPLKESLWEIESVGEKINILAVGPRMLSLARSLSSKDVGVISVRSVKPLDEKVLLRVENTTLITLEENSVIGGFGSLILSFFAKEKKQVKVITCGVKDGFIEHGTIERQLKENGLYKEKIEEIIKENL